MKNYVYAFVYCPCIHESSFGTISLHRTERGAQIAMSFHKEAKRIEHEEMYEHLSKEERDIIYLPFDKFEAWDVDKVEILE